MRVNVFGASGAGTTSLGRALADRLAVTFFDADDFFWELTDPPYQTVRGRALRQSLLMESLAGADAWILAGSICGWGDDAIPLLDFAVIVITPTALRLDRLRDRERTRFGERIARGGDMHEQHRAFLDWAAQYDDGPSTMRSRRRHDEWQAQLPCPVIRVDGSLPLQQACDEIVWAMTT
jgi:adenylate kinase family enzyme